MMKRGSLLLSVAAGLAAIMSLGMSCQAGSVTEVTTTAVLQGDYTVDSLVVNYSFGSLPAAFTDLNLAEGYPPGTLSSITSGSTGTVTDTYTTPALTPVTLSEFTFTVPVSLDVANAQVTITSAYFVTTGGDVDITIHPTFSSVAVPEPSSIALLGVGLTGLFAVRRFVSGRKSTL